MVCRICQSSHTKAMWRGREMMHGLRDVFDYFECASCGCVQIAEWPADLEKYYPNNYYSMKWPNAGARLVQRLQAFSTTVGLGPLWAAFSSRPHFVPSDLPRSTHVLDIGSGSGESADQLSKAGFRNVHGIDPNLDPTSERTSPYRLERTTAEALVARGERYGFIYLSHSLEHMQDQHHALDLVRKLLAPDGLCCIRIPWVSCEAWERYGADWVQLDAPRHFYLHSRASFDLLVKGANFRISKLWCDSTGFQFWGSEQYQNDIPLYSERSWLVSRRRSMFSREQVDAYESRARELNVSGRGDQIVAWLAPVE